MEAIEVLADVPGGRRLAPGCRRLLVGLMRRVRRPHWSVTLLLTSDVALRRLNRAYLGRDRVTDVLSFPARGDLEPGRRHLGDIAISVPRARRQSRRARWSLREEMALLVTHGVLHLMGYDHETDGGTMRCLERDLLRRVAGVTLGRRALPWGDDPAGAPRRARRAPGGMP